MEKELAEIRRHAKAAIGIPIICFAVIFVCYWRLEAVRNPAIESRSPYESIVFMIAIFQSLFGIGSGRPWKVLPLFILIAFPFVFAGAYFSSGPLSIQPRIREHIADLEYLKPVTAVVLCIVIAIACHLYLRRCQARST